MRYFQAGNDSIVTATITIDTAGKPSATLETSVPKLNKSFSEPSLDSKRRGCILTPNLLVYS